MSQPEATTAGLINDPALTAYNRVVVKKLIEITRYMVSAERLRWYKLYVAHSFYSYTSEFAAALIGIGISFPLAQVVSGKPPSSPDWLSTLVGNKPYWEVVIIGLPYYQLDRLEGLRFARRSP